MKTEQVHVTAALPGLSAEAHPESQPHTLGPWAFALLLGVRALWLGLVPLGEQWIYHFTGP